MNLLNSRLVIFTKCQEQSTSGASAVSSFFLFPPDSAKSRPHIETITRCMAKDHFQIMYKHRIRAINIPFSSISIGVLLCYLLYLFLYKRRLLKPTVLNFVSHIEHDQISKLVKNWSDENASENSEAYRFFLIAFSVLKINTTEHCEREMKR